MTKLPPLTSDEWKPRHRAYAKPYGLRIYYIPRCFRTVRFMTRWYATEKGREQGRAAALKDQWMRVERFELLKRS